MIQGVCILGSTGSIGCSTLDVIQRNPDVYRVDVLTANKNVEKILAQCIQFKPRLVVMNNAIAAEELSTKLAEQKLSIDVQSGELAMAKATAFNGVSVVVAAIVGAAGLLPTLAAVKAGHKVLLANKEALVMSGELFIKAVAESGATLLPVDSEHNAIFQCLPVDINNARPDLSGVDRVLLTGSGGPFRTLPVEQLSRVSPEQACSHPNWDMGQKISVDSATMMNKGLELIEACFLFNLSLSQIDIVVHPQSIVHSMVSYNDGSVLAQMGKPDMRTPIAHTLAWPNRIESGVDRLNVFEMSNLTFERPDYQRFPCLKLASDAMRSGGTAPCVLNAANEVAVEQFLQNKIRFTDISQVIEQTMNSMEFVAADTLEAVLDADNISRKIAQEFIDSGLA